MVDIRIRLNQINADSIANSVFASKTEVNSVQANVTAANTWVNANDFSTLLSARSNDWTTLLTAQANDGATLLTARSNDWATLLTAQANDFNSFTTLTANIYNTFAYLDSNTNPAGSDQQVQFNNNGSFGANSSLIFDGATLKAPMFEATQSSGDEGGELKLNKPATNTTINNGITIDVFQDRVRLFETGGTNRGGYWDITALSAGVGTNLLSGGGGGDVANAWVNANDYSTLLSAYSNDGATLLTARSNDFNSYNTLTANIYNTLLTAQSNDYNTYTSLSANDYNSYTTLTANIYNTYASLFANLGVGGGNVTNTVSITPVFSGALRTTNATQTLGTASWTTLTGYDNVIYDTNSFTSVADRFTIPAGVTKVKLAGSVAGTSAIGQLITRILKNANTAISYTTEVDIESTGADNGVVITPVVSVVEGDYFVLQAFSDNSRTVSVDLVSWFSIEVVEGSVLTATANLTISSAGNAWVNANDFSTYNTLTANSYNTLLAAYSNDLSTLNSARANDYATLLSAQSNDYATLLSAQANDFNSYTSLSANDYNSFTTLTANIYNTFAYLNANVGGGGGDVANAWVNANDYSTFTTLTANIYNTYETLSSAPLYAQKFTVDGSTNSFTLSNSVSTEEAILVYIDGVVQHSDAYVVSGTTLTIANTLPLPTSTLGIRRLSGTTTNGSSTGGLSYLRTYALG